MDSVFVGREAELKTAGELLTTARGGTESVLCLQGGPGIGKTALTRAIIEKGRQAGLLVLTSTFVDGQDLPPLWPWRRILSKAARLAERGASTVAPAVALHGEPASFSQLLSRHEHLLSHVTSDWGQVPGLSELPPDQRKYRFFEWISQFLHDLARSTPIAIVLEDLHNGDDASLHLTRYLIDVLEYSAVFMLLTWRPAELRGSSRLTELQEQVRLLQSSSTIELAGFGQQELKRYLAEIAGVFGNDDVEHVLAWTQGVPLRAYLYAERLGPELAGGSEPILTMSQLFWKSLRRELSPSACRTVEQLALLGNGFTRDEIDALAADGTTHEVREELLTSGLIRCDDESGFHHFFHDELRVAVLELLTVEERERQVEEVTSRIEAIPEADTERRTRLLKELFLSARSNRFAVQAIHYTLQAVEFAERQNAWPEVISDLERLITQHTEEIGPEKIRDLQLRLCRAYHHSFNEPAGVPLAIELFDHFKSEGDTGRLIELVLNFGFGWALEARDVFSDILALIESLPEDHPKRAALLTATGTSFVGGLDPTKAHSLSHEAIDLARACDDRFVEISATVCLAMSLKRLRRFEEAIQTVDALLKKHPGKIGIMELTYALLVKHLALLGMGRLAAADQVLHEMRDLSRLVDDPVLQVYLRYSTDRKALKRGDWHRLSIDAPKGSEADFELALPAVTAAYLTGRVDAADRFVEQFMETTGVGSGQARNHDEMCTAWLIALRAYVLSDARWVDDCARYLPKLARSIGAITGYLTDFPICAARISRLEPCSIEEAHDYYDRLLVADSYAYEDEEYTVTAAKALLALKWGDSALAVRHFEEAIVFCDKYDEKPWRAHYVFELALLLPSAERARAHRLVQEARSEAERLGLKPLLSRMEREGYDGVGTNGRSTETSVDGQPSKSPEDWVQVSGITRREHEVLQYLVGGLTDKEIAAALNISPYTVGNHLRKIYAKTQCANRGEAVHWAISTGVVRVESGNA